MPDIGGPPGTALVLAAAPAGRHQFVDATAVLPALSAVAAAVLTGTDGGSVTQLVNPADPQAVLAQIRTVAQAPGPLTVVLVGQLHLDRRARQPHLALAGTTAATVRYSALPWQWIAHEIRLRPAGSTTVFADLVADEAAFARVAADRAPLSLGPGVALFGAVTLAGRHRAAPVYAQALAAYLRAGARPPVHQLHQTAVQRADLPPQAVLLATPPPTAPEPIPAPAPAPTAAPAPAPEADPHLAILGIAAEGRCDEAAQAAAAWQEHAERTEGAGSRQAVQWTEVRADIARLAGDAAASTTLWLSAAGARLSAGQPAEHPDVEGAVDRAHHQWTCVRDEDTALALAEHLLAYRRHVPGRRPGAVEALRQRIAELESRGEAPAPAGD